MDTPNTDANTQSGGYSNSGTYGDLRPFRRGLQTRPNQHQVATHAYSNAGIGDRKAPQSLQLRIQTIWEEVRNTPILTPHSSRNQGTGDMPTQFHVELVDIGHQGVPWNERYR